MKRGHDLASWLVLISALGLAFFFTLFSCQLAHALPWICPPARVNDQTTVLLSQSRTKPALYSFFADSVYSTCFERISDSDSLPDGSAYNPVPLYSQLQAWNSNQTLIYLADRWMLNSPSYTKYRRLGVSGNFRWSPIYPDTGYYTDNSVGTYHPKFVAVNVNTDGTRDVKQFSEYGGIETGNEQEDLSRNGRYVVLSGYKHRSSTQAISTSNGGPDTIVVACSWSNGGTKLTATGGGQFDSLEVGAGVFYLGGSGIQTHTKITFIDKTADTLIVDKAFTAAGTAQNVAFTNSEAFCFDVVDGRKVGTSIPAWGWQTGYNNGLADMLMSPSGRDILLHWNTGGIVAYDTLGNQLGKVMCGHGHYDVTQDQNGREWVIAATTASPCGPSGAKIAKFRIPDALCSQGGYDMYVAQSNAQTDTTVMELCNWSDSAGGVHVSGRAFDTGFVILSCDMEPNATCGGSSNTIHPTTHAVPFSQEIVKLYLDSTVGTPHLERLADHRSDPWYQSQGPCAAPGCGYWAQAHASPSRDGTRVIWGSTWGAQSGACAAEAYVMDICNKARNETFVNMPVNTWRPLVGVKAKSFDGSASGTAPGDTLWPFMSYTFADFSPEFGSVLYYGSGGHGSGSHMGNDLWEFSPSDSTFRQDYEPDSTNSRHYPGGMGQTVFPAISSGATVTGTGIPGGTTVVGAVSAGANTLTMSANATATTRNIVATFGGSTLVGNCNTVSGSSTLTTTFFPYGYSMRSAFNWTGSPDPAILYANAVPAAWKPWGATSTGKPFSSHQYDQKAWDNRNRVYRTWNPSYIFVKDTSAVSDGYFAFYGHSNFAYSPYTKTWATPSVADTFPDEYSQNGGGDYDPINRKTVAIDEDVWHTASGTNFNTNRTWVRDSTGTWARKTSAGYFGGSPVDTFYTYGNHLVYDRRNAKMLAYWGCDHPGAGCTGTLDYNAMLRWYDSGSDAWSKPPTLSDPVHGYPPKGDAVAAYDTKDGLLFIHGFLNNFGGQYVPTWSWRASDGQWNEPLPPYDPGFFPAISNGATISGPGITGTLTVSGAVAQGATTLTMSGNASSTQANVALTIAGSPVYFCCTTSGSPTVTICSNTGESLVYDPTNNVFLMLTHSNASLASGIGKGDNYVTNNQGATGGTLGQIFVYKPSAGDGRLFQPITVSGGSCGTTSGF